jgi:microcystin-dependent protein
MGSSLYLQGGAATQNSVKETFVQASHGFAVGTAIRFDPSIGGASGAFVKARADTAVNAEVIGVVGSVQDADTFTVVYQGAINIPALAGVSFPALFLSDTILGGITHNPPSTVGSIIKPVILRAASGNRYNVVNYLGTQIGGSSTVSIDEIQPVGTIMPFAGTVIPDTWLECNGQPVGVTAYPELYDKLLYTALPRAPMYGHRVRLTGTGLVTANFAVDDVIQFKTGTAAWTGGLYDSNCTVLGRIVSLTSSTSATAAGTMVVQMLAKYDITADGVNAAQRRSFSYPNALFAAGTGVASQTAAAAGYRVFNSSGAFRGGTPNISVTSVSITDFLTPDLRGRFSLGKKTDAIWINEFDGDAANQQSIGSFYDQGVFGGEEQHLLSVSELPSHSHDLKTLINAFPIASPTGNLIGPDNHNTNFNGTVNAALTGSDGLPPRTATRGSNTPHNNMPPYLAMRHIIKAKPYARAAIIDDVDIDYSKLLVTDLRSGLLRGGGVGEDLIFKTNDSTTSSGVERMRLTNTPSGAAPGGLILGDTTHTPYNSSYRLLEVAQTSGNGGGVFVARSSNVILESGVDTGTLNGGIIGTRTSHPVIFRTNTNEQMRIDSNGNVGINTTAPTAQLTIFGADGTKQGLFVNLNGTDAATVATSLTEMWARSPVHIKGAGTSTTRLLVGGVASGSALQSSNANGAGALGLALQPFGGNVTIGTNAAGTSILDIRSKNDTGSFAKFLVPAGTGIDRGLHLRSSAAAVWIAELDTDNITSSTGWGLLIRTGNLTQSDRAALSIDAATSPTNATLVSTFDVYNNGNAYLRGNLTTGTSITSTTPTNAMVTKAYVDSLLNPRSPARVGYLRIGNVLIQWGRLFFDDSAWISGNAWKTATFPVSFSGIPWSVVCTPILQDVNDNTFGSSGAGAYDKIGQVRTITQSNVELVMQGTGGGSPKIWMSWMAIGPA